jgi:hypothetical protein
MIPRRIHQFFGIGVPGQPGELVSSWQRSNPGYEHILWSEEAASAFVVSQFGEYAGALFRECDVFALKYALFGHLVLLVHGGIYVDPGLECVSAIEPLIGSLNEHRAYGTLNLQRSTESESYKKFAVLAGGPGETFFGRMSADILNEIASGSEVSRFAVRPDWRGIESRHGEQAITLIEPGTAQYFWKWDSSESSISSTRDDLSTVARKPHRLSEAVPTREVRWAKLLFLGHPRCGSGALAAMLTAAGVDIGHEKLKRDGAVSWWHTGNRIRNAGWPLFSSGTRERREIWLASSVFHYLRNPRHAIPSIILENEANGRENNSFKFRRQKLKKIFDVDIARMAVVEAAAVSYALWNNLAAGLATAGQVLVEYPQLGPPYSGLPLDAALRRNSSQRKFGKSAPEIDFRGVIAGSSDEVRRLLKQYASLYEEE